MPQGDALPALHSWNIGQNFYVDGVNGNDTTGDGSSGSPWATLQKVHNELRDNVSWVAAGQDVAVNIRAGTYKAANTNVATLDIFFNNASRCPLSNRFLIWKPDEGHEGQVIIQNPDGTSDQRGCVRLQNGGAARMSYIIFSGLEFDGEDTRKGAIGNGNSYGIYFGPFGANTATDCEVLDCEIHGFQVNGDGVQQCSAQGIPAEVGADGLKIVNCRIHDIGTTSLTSDFQEHGLYLQGHDTLVLNTLIYNIPNGYNLQFYSGGANEFDGSIVAHCTLDDAEASGIVIHGNASDVAIKNCVITNHTGRGASSYGIEYEPAGNGSATGSVVDHIIYDNNQGGNREASPTGWTFTNETSDDPLYVDQPNADYRLSEGSPAIGYSDTSYSPSTDINGNSRAAGNEDAGAFEFTAAAGGGGVWFVD